MSLIDALDDRALILVLQEYTEDLQDGSTSSGQLTESESREALRELTAGADLDGVLDDEAAALAAARRLLTVALDDSESAAVVVPIIEDPPADDQLAVETAAAGLVVLGALIAWLQTKVDIKIHRKDGKTEFLFHLRKAAADPQTIQDLSNAAAQVLTGNGPTQP